MNIFNKLKKCEINTINLIIEYCIEVNISCYLVGGIVRDTLLDQKYRDIDICIETDPLQVLNFLQFNYPTLVNKVNYHKEFMTATVEFKNGVKLDLIRCREEVYLKDGELPKITPSNLKADLKRRDFTINSLAYDLIKEELIDFEGGVKDLKSGLIKKIHINSYEEDPTRIFRAIKYAVRYQLKMHDKNEIVNLIRENIIVTVSNDRLMKEIIQLLEETEWRECISKCVELELFKINFQLFEKKSFLYQDELIEHRLFVLFSSLEDSFFESIFMGNSLLNRDIKKGFNIFKENHAYEKLINEKNNYRIYKELIKLNKYEILALSFRKNTKYKLLNYISNITNIKTDINGKNLKEYGIKEGKIIGRIIEEITRINNNTLIKLDDLSLAHITEENIHGCKYKN